MGTSMTDAANAGSHVLDFTQSINEEMEASVLLGRSINFQSVRQLTYNRDLEGAAKRTVELAKQAGFLHKMDTFQMNAFAKMSGYSVDQLTNMVQTSEQLEKIRRSGTPWQIEELANYEKMHKEIESSAKLRAADGMIGLRTMANQDRITQLTSKWNQFLAKAQQFLLPIIDKILGFVVKHFDAIKWVSIAIGTVWLANKILLGGWGTGLMISIRNLTSFLALSKAVGISQAFSVTRIGMWAARIGTAFSGIGAMLAGWGTAIMGGLSSIGAGLISAIMSPIALITAAFAAGFGIGTLLNKFKFVQNAAQAVWLVIFKIGDVISETFSRAWKGLKNGIISIGPMLFNALTRPWNLAFMAIIKFVPMVGKMIWAGISAYFNKWKTIGVEVFNGAKYLGEMIFNGLKSVAGKIISAVTSPFKHAWSAVKSLWGGHSPSQVGLSILQGITSIGEQMHSALTSPFRKGMDFIMNKIPGLHKIVDMIHGGMPGAVEKRAQAAYIPAVTVTPKGTQIETPNGKAVSASKEDKASSQAMSEETGQRMVALLEKILAKDNSLYVDGSLLSTKLARSIEFKGNFGVNK